MRLIDADELEKNLSNDLPYKGSVKRVLIQAPTVDAEPVRRGRNENREYHEADEFICSECGLHLEDWTRYVYDEDSDEEYVQEYVFKRCPECGARIVDE